MPCNNDEIEKLKYISFAYIEKPFASFDPIPPKNDTSFENKKAKKNLKIKPKINIENIFVCISVILDFEAID